MTVTIITILVLIGLFLVALIFAICQHNLAKELKQQLEKSSELYVGLQEEFELYRNAERFKQKKEEEVNEKINEVLSGDSVSNAINILSKHKD